MRADSRHKRNAEQQAILEALTKLLLRVQWANEGLSFGVCHTCNHFRTEAGGTYRCGLTDEPLTTDDIELICREHMAMGS